MAEEFDLVPGVVYKRTDLHDRFAGQTQGGISTPKKHPFLMLFINDSGSLYGYKDGPQEDGMFWYTGEGQVGDMRFIKGNKAVRDHLSKGKSLHLFEGAKKTFVRYIGQAELVRHHETIAPDIEGNDRKVIVFELELRPEGTVDTSFPEDEGQKALARLSLKALRKAAMSGSSHGAEQKLRVNLTFRRSEAIKLYVKKRANGVCEACREPAPFNTKKGLPYLEPHHITRLADGGPDHPAFVAAICPTCHRRIHHGADGDAINAELLVRIGQLEQ